MKSLKNLFVAIAFCSLAVLAWKNNLPYSHTPIESLPILQSDVEAWIRAIDPTSTCEGYSGAGTGEVDPLENFIITGMESEYSCKLGPRQILDGVELQLQKHVERWGWKIRTSKAQQILQVHATKGLTHWIIVISTHKTGMNDTTLITITCHAYSDPQHHLTISRVGAIM